MLENLFSTFRFFLNHPVLVIAVSLSAIGMKSFFLYHLLKRRIYASIPYYLILCILVSTMLQDSEWILWCIKQNLLNDIDFRLYIFWTRLAWAAAIANYQFLALFLESLATPKFKLSVRNKIFISISMLIVLTLICNAIFNSNCIQRADRPPFEFTLINSAAIYAMFPLLLSSIYIVVVRLYTRSLPTILHKQLVLLIVGIIIPFWFFDFLQIFPFIVSSSWINAGYAFMSNICITIAIFYCSRKILGLRFLNFSSQVHAPININFMEKFKVILEQFSRVINISELNHITKLFFKDAFGIPFNRIQLYIRSTKPESNSNSSHGGNEDSLSTIELFMSTQPQSTIECIKKAKILIYDELAFNNFYKATPEESACLSLLEAIQADILLPIYEKESLMGYISVDRFSRPEKLYNTSESDEMLIFAQYLGNIINLMRNKNLDELIRQEKNLQDELYNKHQEINQYKESIRSFLRAKNHKKIGVIFYKNRNFMFGNQAAKELIPINPNMQDGHLLTKALKNIAQQVEEYKSAQTAYVQDTDGTRLVISGVPGIEQNNVIICVYYPEVSDIIKKQIDILKDPSEWDYLLYLETTKPGKLINQLIPGNGETLLNFKIELLKTALHKKATLLNMPENDLIPTVELLHHISLRNTLHIIDLDGPEQNFSTAIKLFGINAIFYGNQESELPILEKLDTIGTLFIKNVQFLAPETQKYLAEFIRYGFFRVFKSDRKISSNVRIICSTNQNLLQLTQEGKFSKQLFEELKHTVLEMPSLMILPEDELALIADGFSEQALSDQSVKNILSLSPKDKSKLIHQRPASLSELKTKVQQILLSKSKQENIFNETQFDPAYDISDPDLVEAARLGKKALKDQKIMSLLWTKFKNQNKIALFLGVNRSSVNRRCKEYKLIS